MLKGVYLNHIHLEEVTLDRRLPKSDKNLAK